MDNRPIGVFDSGLGGLTAVKELIARAPAEDVVFFGDTGRVPYGTRSAPTIIRYAAQDLRFLCGFDVKAVLIACGTVSATALPALRESSSLPIYGVVESAARAAVRATRTGRIGVIGTSASIRSGTYERLIREHLPEAVCESVACPLLVPLVENGRTDPGDPVLRTVLSEYLAPILAARVDTLILGCTHYPLLRPAIAELCGADVALIDPGAEAADSLCDRLAAQGLSADPARQGALRVFVSDDPAAFSENGGRFLGRDIQAQVSLCEVGAGE